jgi:hypothetical protein
MVSAVSSVNQYPVNREVLEVVRRLQSLGVAPTGDISLDRQRLQTAEFQKKQITLASNSEVNLTKLAGTGKDFSSTLDLVQNIQQVGETNGLIKNADSDIAARLGMMSVADAGLQQKMVGATQLAELNKLKLGLIA